MPKKAICPHCNSEMTELEITEIGTDVINKSVKRFGYSDLEGGNVETNDSETTDSNCVNSETDETHYFCPECKEELQPEYLEIKDEEEKDKTKNKINKPDPIMTQDAAEQELVRHDYGRFHCNSMTFLVCSKCDTKVEIHIDNNRRNQQDEHEEDEVECTSCGKIITRKTAKQVINA